MGRGVVSGLAVGSRTTRPALVEQHDPVILRVKEAAVLRGTPGSRSTVKEQYRYPGRIAALFPIDRVKVVYG
jgi:hypothetical protein